MSINRAAHSGGDQWKRLADVIERFDELRVLVVGDCFLDDWVHGYPSRLCREAPVPVIDVMRHQYAGGGAANTAANVAALGARSRLISATGDDAVARQLGQTLVRAGVDHRFIPVPHRRTITKRRIVVDEQIMFRFDEGDTEDVADEVREALLAKVELGVGTADALLVCDYGTGICTPGFIAGIAARREKLPLLAIDAHDPARWAATRPDLMTPSFDEVRRLLRAASAGSSSARPSIIAEHSAELLDRTNSKRVAITVDSDGAVACERGCRPHRTYASRVPAHHTIGAGDSYFAAFALALAADAPTVFAAEVAQLAATIAIRGSGTAVCGVEDLLVTAGRAGRRVVEATEAARQVALRRRAGERIVFTNGCFDVVHRGHIAYLDAAKQLGDVLVVAVNSDASVRRLKGDERPINNEVDRSAVVGALSCVDYVVVFGDDSPTALLTALRPDLYVKGGDYTPEMIPERELVERLGGEVRVLDYVPDRSTSEIIARIRSGAERRTGSEADVIGLRT